MPTEITSPTDIEIACEAYIVQKLAAFKAARRQQNLRYIFTDPAVVVSIYEGKLEPLGPEKFRATCPLHVELSVTNAKGEEARRDGINPLVFALIRTLSRQKFGLAIAGLMPRGFKDVTTDDDYKNNKIVYDIEFSTRFSVLLVDEEVAEDFLTLALSYYLEPDDAVAAAADTVNLVQI